MFSVFCLGSSKFQWTTVVFVCWNVTLIRGDLFCSVLFWGEDSTMIMELFGYTLLGLLGSMVNWNNPHKLGGSCPLAIDCCPKYLGESTSSLISCQCSTQKSQEKKHHSTIARNITWCEKKHSKLTSDWYRVMSRVNKFIVEYSQNIPLPLNTCLPRCRSWVPASWHTWIARANSRRVLLGICALVFVALLFYLEK